MALLRGSSSIGSNNTVLALFKKTLAKKTSALDSPDICTFTAPSN